VVDNFARHAQVCLQRPGAHLKGGLDRTFMQSDQDN